MTTREAREILELCRPGTRDEEAPEAKAALAELRRNPELAAWYERHSAFQAAMRAKLRAVPTPSDLRNRLLARRRIIRPAFWQRPPVWLAAAAMLLLLIGVAQLTLRPPVPDRFTDYRSRMVRTALREYRMDVATNDLAQVRSFMESRGAPGNFEIPPGLAEFPLAGGGFLQWRGHPVSMVCFHRDAGQMLYLFVLRRSVVRDAPPAQPELAQVNKLFTLSWTQGEYTYVLASPEEADVAATFR